MQKPNIPDVLTTLVQQMQDNTGSPRQDTGGHSVNTFVFQVGQGGVVQFVLGNGVLDRPSAPGPEGA